MMSLIQCSSLLRFVFLHCNQQRLKKRFEHEPMCVARRVREARPNRANLQTKLMRRLSERNRAALPGKPPNVY